MEEEGISSFEMVRDRDKTVSGIPKHERAVRSQVKSGGKAGQELRIGLDGWRVS